MRYRITDGFVAFVLVSVVVATSVRLQGFFSMEGTAAVFTMGCIFLFGFVRFSFMSNKVKIFYLGGSFLAALWYPFFLVLFSGAEGGGPRLWSFGFYWCMLTSLRYREAYLPVLSVMLFSVSGVLVGSFLHRLKEWSAPTRGKPRS